MSAEKPVFLKEQSQTQGLEQKLEMLRALGRNNRDEYDRLKTNYGQEVAEDVGVYSGNSKEASKVLSEIAKSIVGIDDSDVDPNLMEQTSSVLISEYAATSDLIKRPGATVGITVDYSGLDNGDYYITLDRVGGGHYEDVSFVFRNNEFVGGKISKGDSDGQFRSVQSELNFNKEFVTAKSSGEFKSVPSINVKETVERIVK
jgi:hypothetical protein